MLRFLAILTLPNPLFMKLMQVMLALMQSCLEIKEANGDLLRLLAGALDAQNVISTTAPGNWSFWPLK